jgi:hypothetical protein
MRSATPSGGPIQTATVIGHSFRWDARQGSTLAAVSSGTHFRHSRRQSACARVADGVCHPLAVGSESADMPSLAETEAFRVRAGRRRPPGLRLRHGRRGEGRRALIDGRELGPQPSIWQAQPARQMAARREELLVLVLEHVAE